MSVEAFCKQIENEPETFFARECIDMALKKGCEAQSIDQSLRNSISPLDLKRVIERKGSIKNLEKRQSLLFSQLKTLEKQGHIVVNPDGRMRVKWSFFSDFFEKI